MSGVSTESVSLRPRVGAFAEEPTERNEGER